ncbi:MAG TPA: aspartate kinase [bacterium]
MKVLKFGGTSIGTPERMKVVAQLVTREPGVLVVLSALSKTTDKLLKIGAALASQNIADAQAMIDELYKHYQQYVDELYITPQGRKQGWKAIERHFDLIRGLPRETFDNRKERLLVAQGELMSTAMFHHSLEEQGVATALLPALEFVRLDDNGEPELNFLRVNLTRMMAEHPAGAVLITQGYICRNAWGEIDNLKRGGSDYTASLLGAALRCEEIQIWTDIDGMHNNDPRYVQDTYPIRELSFDEAAELAYFGAKILHPASVQPAKMFNVPVRLLNTMEPSASGTLIADKTGEGDIKAVAAKDGITAINIKSSRMFLAYGFLRRVFEVFERYKTPIDMITTAEVAVSLTIDNPQYLRDIVAELKQFGAVEVDHEQTIICVVGKFLAENTGIASRLFLALKDFPIRMISYGGSSHNISILVRTDLKPQVLVALNEGLFGKSRVK